MKKTIQQTFKYRLKPNKEQRIKLAQHAGTARYIYNWGLGMVKKALDGDLKMPSYYDLAGKLPLLKLSTVTQWLKQIHSQIPQQALLDLYRALTAFFTAKKNKKKSRFPKFRRRGKFDSFRYPQNVKCENGKVYLPKIGWVPYRDSRPIEGKIKQATIKRIGKHWYICIVCEKEIDIDIVPISDDDAVGIDVGISCYAATSNGEKIPNPAYLRALLDTLRYLSRSLSRKKKYSQNWKKCVVRIQQLHIRIVNLRNDFLHKLSTLIAKNHGVVCVEDLNIKGMMKNGRLSRSIADAAWGKFHEFMRYKCDWNGKHFKKIGDLSRRRLIPTLYEIVKHRKDLTFSFIGAAKDEIAIEDLIKKSIPSGDKEVVEELMKRSSYQAIDFTKPETFKALADLIANQEKAHSLSGQRLVYLAVASQWYSTITKLLHEYEIIKRCDTHRIVYEKPFGWDAESAREINACITKILDEDQIYRVDHYLSKALVTSLLLTRFSNVFFEPVWNSQYIDQVQIILSETITLQGRGDFYDQYGALKDVVQNHMLQLLAYIGMEQPPSFTPGIVSTFKSYILNHTTITDGLLGQYENYRSVPGVAADSTRETYVLLRAEIHTPRWQNVPFFIKTGKALDYKSTEIHIVFKPQSKRLIHKSGLFDANRLIIRISPDSAILLRLNAQKGREPAILPISMEFCYRCTFGSEQPHSYETLFYEIMLGDKSAVVSLDEIVYAWNIINDIKNLSLPLYPYAAGSSGPQEAEAFSKKYDISWDPGATSAKPS